MLLVTLGTRLRSRRQALSMTQAQVAERAKVSQRFLVKVERGEGNISVTRLASLCQVLGLPLDRLFQGIEQSTQKIALVGLRGAGKSTLGALLARALEVPFVELDQLIEEEAGMILAEIFQLHGETHYRNLEGRVLARVLDQPGPAVLATGGSIVLSEGSWQRLANSTTTVWLQASPSSHLSRVQAQGDLRPMAGRPNALQEIGEILAERGALYARAEHTVDTDTGSPENIVATMVQQFTGGSWALGG